ncbi:hypothetical protein VP1G_00469 [Cytospora mali]|uniref:Uncharacterized protein n=1 Tax=Cytospora mali TaxID=578113 RepID=A0A194UMQ4_CYTMA|nr:hypothetical protein VP1G_00469 [Valsa mali var. pyri (nom. inval.)]
MSTLRSISNALRAPVQGRARALAHRQFLSPASLQSSFHSTTASLFAYKDDQSRETLKPQSTQGSMSGTDQEAAESDAAFDPSTTSPESEKNQAEDGSGGNPLETSGANHSKSKPPKGSGEQDTQNVTRQENKKSSGGHSPQKKG